MTDSLVAPTVPGLDDEGWECIEAETETLFQMAAMRIRGATRRYDDRRSRQALQSATGIDHPVRFLAATRLGFEPPPPPGIGPRMFAPTLRSELRRTFPRRLEDRGLTDVGRTRKERHRLPDRTRAHLTAYSAIAPLSDGQSLPLECQVAVWITDGVVRILSGGYPAVALDAHFGLDTDREELRRSPQTYRDGFFDALDRVGETSA